MAAPAVCVTCRVINVPQYTCVFVHLCEVRSIKYREVAHETPIITLGVLNAYFI